MTATLTRVNTWCRHHTWSLLLAWVVVLAWFGTATWLKVARQHREVQAVEKQLADLNRWNVAGMWLSRSLAAREPAVAARWDVLFPVERRREELFLDLARIADTSGVKNFELVEKQDAEADMTTAGTDMYAPVDLAPVETYRVEARFLGGYGDVARFLGGLNGIARAMSLHNLSIAPSRGDIQVELELDIYVSKPTQS